MRFKILCLFFLLSISKTNCKPRTEESSECSVIETGSGLSKPCQFPFVYAGQSFDKCIFKYNRGNGKPWCSTKTDPMSNEHIGTGGNNGDCYQESCPVDENEFGKLDDQSLRLHSIFGKYWRL